MTNLYLRTEKSIKRKNLVIGLTVAIVLIFNSCTTSTDNIKLFPIKSGEKWGYVNDKGEYVINSQFEEAYNFSEGLALFKSADGKFGFISEDGKYAINPIYKSANSFSEGLACVVMENGKPQFIDKDNKILFTVDKAEYCYGFKEGLARVQIKGKYGFIDKTGKVIINPIYEDAKDFSEGLVAVAKKNENKNEILWGYIDKTGAVKINFQFVKGTQRLFFGPGSFNEGLAFTSTNGNEWGCIDKEGKYQINPQFEGDYEPSYKFKNGVALVSQGNSYGFIDKKGKYVINPQFIDANSFSGNNYAAVQHSDRKWGFINKEGKYVINPQFEDVATGFFGNVAFVKSSDKYGIINKKGLYIVNPQFDDVILEDIGINYRVKTDFVDYAGIAEMLLENSNSSQHFGYDKNTTLGDIIDDYPETDISDLNPNSLKIKNPNIAIRDNDMIESGQLTIGFNQKTYSETPIYKTVEKYNYYTRRYYNEKQFERMDKKIENSSLVSYTLMNFYLKSIGKGKGKTLADAIKTQAINKMNLTEVNDFEVNNTDFKGIYLLKNEDLFFSIQYSQNKNSEASQPSFIVVIINKNFSETFDEFAKNITDDFNEK